MSEKLNILFVSIAFPPKMDPECLQVAKYIKYLSRDKSLNIEVVTSPEKTLFMPIDNKLRAYSQEIKDILHVPFFENRYINFLMRKFDNEILQYPDSKFRFAKKWRFVLDNLKTKPDILYSRSSPISSTIMAYHLQQKLNIPWVLHLSDPWTIDPDHTYNRSREWNEEMESKCFKKASILSFTSQKTVELYQNKYPQYSEKMRFFPNVFDIEDKKGSNHILKDKIRVVFTGGLVGNRSAEEFFKAITLFNKNHPNKISDFEFIFAGALDRRNRELFQQKIPSVRHIGQLSYSKALELQTKADILLLIDTPFENEDDALFFPSKLLDYMLTQKRIVALTDKNGTSWKFIDKKIGDCFIHKDTTAIVVVLNTIWNNWRRGNKDYFIHSYVDMDYSANINAKKLSILFHSLNKKESV